MSDPGTPPPPPENPYGAAPPPQNPYGGPPAPEYGGAPTGPVARPPAMDRAVLLMRVGAVLSFLSLGTVFFLGDEIRETARQSVESSGETLDPSLMDALVAVGIVVGVVFGLLGVALWLFMAWANGAGKPWARVVASVLYGLSVLSFLSGLLQPAPILSRALSVLTVALGGYIVYLLWQRESSQFYAASSAPRY
ncbi:hypothetical protein JQN72_02690 [Phycicoccus sp. CSK15P-2]|uniref:hypothetical protein n=1 Tax=Phycicoccus sp. CSK15P-2 TaxID=2807627 RepID=UPI00194F6762|nr:hypothetical protein [Phycicoccus sp. CSK15P-2]MBM6403155.1 hypothetical protein [Phycicoccus sp. CSK15P-2]